jgi:hypothetical protein
VALIIAVVALTLPGRGVAAQAGMCNVHTATCRTDVPLAMEWPSSMQTPPLRMGGHTVETTLPTWFVELTQAKGERLIDPITVWSFGGTWATSGAGPALTAARTSGVVNTVQ